jgi:hypothetical protein
MKFETSMMKSLIPVILLGIYAVAASTAELPSGAEVMDKHVEKSGGKAAYDNINNRVVKLTFEMPAQGFQMPMVISTAKPNNVYVVGEAEAIGKIERGVSGDVAWEKNPMMGASVKKGQERVDMLRESQFDKFAYWQKVYDKVECVGIEEKNGSKSFKVILTPKDGTPQTVYFDCETYLLTRHEVTMETQMGKLPTVTLFSDFKKVDGLMIPHKIEQEIMSRQQVMTVTSVEHNVELPETIFAVPEDIKAMME